MPALDDPLVQTGSADHPAVFRFDIDERAGWVLAMKESPKNPQPMDRIRRLNPGTHVERARYARSEMRVSSACLFISTGGDSVRMINPMKGDTIGIGFIGAGRVAANQRAAIERCSGAELRGLFDADSVTAESRSRAWSVPAYASAEALLADPGIAAVFVLTPVEYHATSAIRALEAGKHVLVEKPVSLDGVEIDAMIAAAEASGRLCVPGHSYVYLPAFDQVRRVLDEGGMGTVCHMEMKEFYRMPEDFLPRYHGPVDEVLWHHIYSLLYLLGKPARLCAMTAGFREGLNPGEPEQVVVLAQLPSGATATLTLSWAANDETSDPWTYKLKVIGTDGGATFSRRDIVLGSGIGGPPWYCPMYQESFDREVVHFVRDCIGSGTPPPSTMADARETLNILHAVKRSIADGAVVAVE